MDLCEVKPCKKVLPLERDDVRPIDQNVMQYGATSGRSRKSQLHRF
jgi:hypothetical protein